MDFCCSFCGAPGVYRYCSTGCEIADMCPHELGPGDCAEPQCQPVPIVTWTDKAPADPWAPPF